MFKFDADITSVDTGVWAEFDGSSFLIAHISNMKFQRALARLQQPHRRKIEAGTLDPQTNKNVLCQAMAEGILLDWKGVGSVAAKDEVPYTIENAVTALKKSTELRDFVSDFALNLSNFRQVEVEDLGNS